MPTVARCAARLSVALRELEERLADRPSLTREVLLGGESGWKGLAAAYRDAAAELFAVSLLMCRQRVAASLPVAAVSRSSWVWCQ
jgi:hypothetical protein